jgi:hypothetical protein
MAKKGFGKLTDPMVGKKTQFPLQDPTKGGRPVSIRNQLKDLLEAEGNVTMPANQVVKIYEDGSVVLKLPTQMQLAMKLSSWAMSKKGNDSLKAIQMIMEQIDGKPPQEITGRDGAPLNAPPTIVFKKITNE